ncbi:MAG: zinc ribbon domain-containing protein, partial [Thermodesulfobacteriota bacterium]|nr:zinc ribbon domain-containing protein [Thermodesulfobacteriota bacterium]
IQKHDVKHIRTLYAKDGKTCEIWYYGKTKINNHDIVIRFTISNETRSIELFSAAQTAESLAGLLAEVGRELKSAIESKTSGRDNVQQVINLSIIDSIVQRSNLLSSCNLNGNCEGDVVVDSSLLQRSDIEIDTEVKGIVQQRNNADGNLCFACGADVPDGAKFCMKCGEELGAIKKKEEID